MNTDFRAAAHRYLAFGFQPVGWAIINGTKAAVSMKGRHYRDYTVTHADIEGWNRSWQVGLAMCERSGFWCLDFDCGDDRVREFYEAWLPDRTAVQRTGRGVHFVYRGTGGSGWPRDGVWSSDWMDVQVRSNGFIAAAPSVHPSGRRYAWEDWPPREPGTLLLGSRPERVSRPGGRGGPSRSGGPDADLGWYAQHGIPAGWQDTTLHQLACRYVRGTSDENLFAWLWAAACASPQSQANPWRPEDIRDKIRRAREFTSAEDAKVREMAQAFLGSRVTDR